MQRAISLTGQLVARLRVSSHLFSKYRETIAALAAVIPWIAIGLAMAPRIPFGSDDLRMLYAMPYSADEYYVANTLWSAWSSGIPIFHSLYGSLLFNIGWMVLSLISLVGSITGHTVIVVLRSISLAAYILVGPVSYFWMRRRQAASISLLFTLILFVLCTNRDLMARATICQPDTLNLLMSVVAFMACLDLLNRTTVRNLIVAGGSIGLVMAVKHSGLLFLPLVALILAYQAFRIEAELLRKMCDIYERILGRLNTAFFGVLLAALSLMLALSLWKGKRYSDHSMLPIPPGWSLAQGFTLYFSLVIGVLLLVVILKKLRRAYPHKGARHIFLVEGLLLAGTIFLAVFAATSPSSFLFRVSFIGDSLQSYMGYFQAVSDGVSKWLAILFRDTLGWTLSTVFLAACAAMLIRSLKRGVSIGKDYAMVGIWFCGLLMVIIVKVGMARVRYLYPFFAAIAFISTYAFVYFRARVNSRRVTAFILILAVFAVQFFAGATVLKQWEITKKSFSCLECIPGIQVGRWLARTLPHSSRVFQVDYAYVPPSLGKMYVLSFGDPYAQLAAFKPDIVILSKNRMDYYAPIPDEVFASTYLIKAGITKRFFADFFAGRLPFHKIAEFHDSDGIKGFFVFKR